jgi:hypothetical protein
MLFIRRHHGPQTRTMDEEEDLTVEKIQENLLKLDSEYLNNLIPRHRLLQSALEQLRDDEQKLLELQMKTDVIDTGTAGCTSDKAMNQPESKRFSDAAADRLAQALFLMDDESSDTSSHDG